jgi:hypothetical protein
MSKLHASEVKCGILFELGVFQCRTYVDVQHYTDIYDYIKLYYFYKLLSVSMCQSVFISYSCQCYIEFYPLQS